MFKPKSSNFTRCLTYSASNNEISSQWERMELKVCMYLVNHFYIVCDRFHQNRTTFRVRGLARKKVVKPKSTKVTRCLTSSASNLKISTQGESSKLKLVMKLVNHLYCVCAKFHRNRSTLRIKVLERGKLVRLKKFI